MQTTCDVIIGSDHRGFELKQKVKEFLREKKLFFIDVGVDSSATPLDSEVIPPIIRVVKEASECVASAGHFCGILICGNGIGMSIAANRFKGIRAALCHTADDAKQARQHNDANVLCLGGDNFDLDNVKKIINAFLNTKFEDTVTRYKKRVEQFDKIS